MEEQDHDSYEFAFTWTIEDFIMWSPFLGVLRSPRFVLNSLPDIRWYIELNFSQLQESYIAFLSLGRSSFIPSPCTVTCEVQALDRDETLIYESKEPFVLFPYALKFDGVCRIEGHRLMSLASNILIIKCILKAVWQKDYEELLPQISYETGLLTDVVLHAGGAVFRVHKAMLWARWPKLAELFDTKASSELFLDMKANVLETVLQFIYTGKVDFNSPELLGELYEAAARYGISGLNPVIILEQKARTRVYVLKTSFKWPIKNFSSLPINTELRSHLFTVGKLKSCRFYLTLHILEDVMHNRMFSISLCKIREENFKPIFVKSKISFDESSFQSEYFFHSHGIWKCAEFLRNISKGLENVLLLKCEFKISDCSHSSEIVESSCAFASSLSYHHFSANLSSLYESGTLSDITIAVGSRTLSAHKFILCSRSVVFSRMFQTELRESNDNTLHITDVSPDVMNDMLAYIYSGSFERTLRAILQRPVDPFCEMEKLYSASFKYDVPALKKKCSSYLKSRLTPWNACTVFQLALSHSDDELYKCVLEYTTSHAEDVFSTDK
ncbi:speckle-type POZ protein B-like [Stegodyphus dumicola]|uniref:speckle-type POZ protein B-like n=1 Tax=Stegodyphus dumicola TaxID=202533 RepID=UPI0015AC3D8C|nr:speckle-type POZ protein B-like [Stegodyphus dumicola]